MTFQRKNPPRAPSAAPSMMPCMVSRNTSASNVGTPTLRPWEQSHKMNTLETVA